MANQYEVWGPPGQSPVSAFHKRNGPGNVLVGRVPISADVKDASYKDRLAWIPRLNEWRTLPPVPTVPRMDRQHHQRQN
jgi:hypothetical protein